MACWFADHVVTVTSLWRRTLIDRGVPEHKVSVVMNVADDQIFNLMAVEDVSVPDDRFRLIYHGSLTERYGLDLAVRAVAQLRDRIPGIHLTIHGRGPYLEVLRGLVDELGAEDRVFFSAFGLPTAELPKMIRQATIGIVPNRRDVFTDGILPTKLMEYAALGMPVVAARTPAIDAYFGEGMVQFFEPDNVDDLVDAILSLYQQSQRRDELAQGIQSFNQQYNWTALGAEYAAMVDQLGQRNGGCR